MNFNFNQNKPHSTKLYHYNFRITTENQLEQFVTVIQHVPNDEIPIGVKTFWDPVRVESKAVFVKEHLETDGIIRILLKAFGGFRNVLGTGKFFVDHEGFLNMRVNIFDGPNTILTDGYVMQGPNRLVVCLCGN